MNQTLISAAENKEIPSGSQGTAGIVRISAFQTDLGWFGLWGSGESIWGLAIGHISPDHVHRDVHERLANSDEPTDLRESDWLPSIRRLLERYAQGECVDFSVCRLRLPSATQFQQRVLAQTRKIAYGHTITYGDLAQQSGSPRAARAVGTVMSNNQFPIIIPCHRVVASGGQLGGYSAPQGISLKARLLNLEAQARS